MQPGDVPATYADIEDLARVTSDSDRRPRSKTVLDEFANWFREYHKS